MILAAQMGVLPMALELPGLSAHMWKSPVGRSLVWLEACFCTAQVEEMCLAGAMGCKSGSRDMHPET